MTESLTQWIGAADAIRHMEHFRIAHPSRTKIWW